MHINKVNITTRKPIVQAMPVNAKKPSGPPNKVHSDDNFSKSDKTLHHIITPVSAALGGIIGAWLGYNGGSSIISSLLKGAAFGAIGAAVGGITGSAFYAVTKAHVEEARLNSEYKRKLTSLPGAPGKAARYLIEHGWDLQGLVDVRWDEIKTVRDPSDSPQRVTINRLPFIQRYLEAKNKGDATANSIPDDPAHPILADTIRLVRAKNAWLTEPYEEEIYAGQYFKAANYAAVYDLALHQQPLNLKYKYIVIPVDTSSSRALKEDIQRKMALIDSFTSAAEKFLPGDRMPDRERTFHSLLTTTQILDPDPATQASTLQKLVPIYSRLLTALTSGHILDGGTYRAASRSSDILPFLATIHLSPRDKDPLHSFAQTTDRFIELCRAVGFKKAQEAMQTLQQHNQDPKFTSTYLNLLKAIKNPESAAKVNSILTALPPSLREQQLNCIKKLAKAAEAQKNYPGILIDFITVLTHWTPETSLSDLTEEYSHILAEQASQEKADKAASLFVAQRLRADLDRYRGKIDKLIPQLKPYLPPSKATQLAGPLALLPDSVQKEHIKIIEQLHQAASAQQTDADITLDYATFLATWEQSEPLESALRDYVYLLSGLSTLGMADEAAPTYAYIRALETEGRLPQSRKESIKRFLTGVTAGSSPAQARNTLRVPPDRKHGKIKRKDDVVIIGHIPVKRRHRKAGNAIGAGVQTT